MTKFKIIFRTQNWGDYSGFSVNEYLVDAFVNEEQAITDFLTPENFKNEDFHLIKRLDKYKDDGFLGHALNLNKITLDDFRKISKQKVITLLDASVSKKPNTNSDDVRPNFIEQFLSVNSVKVDTTVSDRYVVEKLMSFIQVSSSETFYFISKHFFETNLDPMQYDENNKLTYNAVIYEPYILIIWFDKKNILNVCEFSAD